MILRRAVSTLALAAALAAPFAAAGAPARAAGPSDNAAVVSEAFGGPLATQPGAAALLAEANSGPIRVIVGIDVAMGNVATMSAAQAAAQTNALSQAQDALVSRVKGLGRNGTTKFETIPFVAMEVTRAELQRLLSDPSVTSIQEDVPAQLYLTQSTPLIRATNVWTFPGAPRTGAGETVAILDTGVRKTHAMFAGGKVASEACFSTSSGTPPNHTQSLCPGGVASSILPNSGLNCNVAIPGCDHGTHVAGIAAGNKTTSPAIRGVAPGARIISIQVFSRFNSVASCGGPPPCILSFVSDQVKGLERVFALRSTFDIAAVNMSLGGGAFTSTCDASSPAQTAIINKLRDVGIATVVASGNGFLDGHVGAPSCISSAIAVGSSTKIPESISFFSNHAPIVKLLAPGSDIRSAAAGSAMGTTFMSGTSMATPHVAGAFALLADVKEGAGVSEILSALNCTGSQLTRGGLQRPRIDLLAARAELLSANPLRFLFTFVTDAASWTPFIRGWGMHPSGSFRGLFTGANVWTFAALKYCSPAFQVVASIRRPAPAPVNPTGVALFSNVSAVGTARNVSGYLFAFNSTTAWVRRFNNVALTGGAAIGNTVQDFCITPRALTPALFHTLRIDTRLGVHSFFVNGLLVCTLTDRMYPPAWVGLMAARPTATALGHQVLVNSVVINPLAPLGPAAIETAGTGAGAPAATSSAAASPAAVASASSRPTVH